MSEYRLTSEIIKKSVAKNWDEAKLEWGRRQVYESDEAETCLCGHYPIKELCVLENKKNGASAIVGNCCVKKFTGLQSDKIFKALKRIRKDIAKSLNGETIEHAHQSGWIDEWEKKFYFDIMRKRNLSEKQKSRKQQINEKILRNMRRAETSVRATASN